MYLEKIELVRTLPCLAEPGKLQIIGRPAVSLVNVIPYMATLPGIVTYNPETPSLTFRRRPGFMTLLADKVTITQVTDHEEGQYLLNSLVEAVNAIWEKRDELAAVTRPARVLRPLDIFALLPQTNCGECGEATCMAFAAKLFMRERNAGECPPLLAGPNFEERRVILESMTG